MSADGLDGGPFREVVPETVLGAREQWRPGFGLAYEKYCEDLLSFLFVPPLNPPIPQSRDERHVNRRDYILPNYAVDGSFWHFMRTHYEAHLVVAEVKNLRQGPGKDESRGPSVGVMGVSSGILTDQGRT